MLTQADARKIAKKLKAKIQKKRTRHELVVVRYNNKYITQFGIQRASKEKSHNYIANQLFVSVSQCSALSKCPLTRDDYFRILTEKQIIP